MRQQTITWSYWTNVEKDLCCYMVSLCHMTNVDQDPCCHILSLGHNALNVTWHTWCSQSAGFFATGISPHTHVHNSCYHHWCLLHGSCHVQRLLHWGLWCHFRDVPGMGPAITVQARYIAVGGVQAMVPRYKWERDISGVCHEPKSGSIFQRVVSENGTFVCLAANSARRQRM